MVDHEPLGWGWVRSRRGVERRLLEWFALRPRRVRGVPISYGPTGGGFEFAKNPSAHGVFGSFFDLVCGTFGLGQRWGSSLFGNGSVQTILWLRYPHFPTFIHALPATISPYIHP